MRQYHCLRRSRQGFSLLELIVVVAVITLLLALLFPAIFAARRSSIQSKCANNLRQIGVAIHDHLTRFSGRAEYCTGAFLPSVDGNFTKVGWVADVVDNKVSGEVLLSPGGHARISKSLSVDELRKAYLKGNLPSFVTADDDLTLTAFQQLMSEQGYNTNYCQLWYMARTDMLNPATRQGSDPNDPLDPKNTYGPLNEKSLRSVSSEVIGLITNGAESIDGMYAEAITAGPLDPTDPQSEQDFTAIGLVHGASARREANILFADGHVDSLLDENNNGQLDIEELQGRMFIRGLKSRPVVTP